MAYVYEHVRKDTKEVFYVGIGSDEFYTRAFAKTGRSEHWKRVVQKVGYEIRLVEIEISWKDACEKEKQLIKEYGRIDKGTGPLVNLTDGGDGLLNPSEDVLLRKSLSVTNTVKGRSYVERYGEEKAKELVRKRSERQKLIWEGRTKEQVEAIGAKHSLKSKGSSKSFKQVTCPSCGKIGGSNVMHKWHFDNCKYKK